jgi:hypothetical protein
MPWSHTHDVAGYLEAGNGIQPGSFVWSIRNPSWVLRVSCVVGRPDWAYSNDCQIVQFRGQKRRNTTEQRRAQVRPLQAPAGETLAAEMDSFSSPHRVNPSGSTPHMTGGRGRMRIHYKLLSLSSCPSVNFRRQFCCTWRRRLILHSLLARQRLFLRPLGTAGG